MDDQLQPMYQRRSFRMSDVQERPIEYVWRGRMAEGMLTLIDGDPGNGKTLLAMDIAARLTRGDPMPDEEDDVRREPASVLLFTAEDNLEQVVKPRMLAAGAVDKRVGFVVKRHVENNAEVPLAIPDDIHHIRDVAKGMVNTKMILIDPIMSYLSTEISSADDMQVRQALEPLTAMAAEVGCSVVMIRHLNKVQGSAAMYRGGGSIAFIGASRFSFMSARHPDDPDREQRVLAPNKINANEDPPALSYTIGTNEEYDQPVIEWGESLDMHAEALVLEGRSQAEQNKILDSVRWLRYAMRNGPVQPQALKSACAKDGFEWSEIKSAIDADLVRRKRNAFTEEWEYYYPDERIKQLPGGKVWTPEYEE